MEETDVALSDVLTMVKAELAETIRLTKTKITAGKLPALKGNKAQLHHLFKNLISNSIKFQKPGSQPQITIRNAAVSADEIVHLGLNIEHTYTAVSFTDNGIGFEKKYQRRIFQVFQRLHAQTEYNGTGIGLAICKKVMENHGGIITAESTPGQGAVFTCYFPV